MCNILTYTYKCTHTHTHLRSPCRGTIHKPLSPAQIEAGKPVRAACSATASDVVIHMGVECGTCGFKEVEEIWRQRIERGSWFRSVIESLDDMGDCCVGYGDEGRRAVGVLDGLMRELEGGREREIWRIARGIYPPSELKRRRPRRPKPGVFRAGVSSPLRNEEAIEELSYSTGTAGQDWWTKSVEEYDWDYEASTDPIHPVNTDYDALWRNEEEDMKWIEQFLEEGVGNVEEGGQNDDYETPHLENENHNSNGGKESVNGIREMSFGDQDRGWQDWEDGQTKQSGLHDAFKVDSEKIDHDTNEPNTRRSRSGKSLIAYGPSSEHHASGTVLVSMATEDEVLARRRKWEEELIEQFWKVVYGYGYDEWLRRNNDIGL